MFSISIDQEEKDSYEIGRRQQERLVNLGEHDHAAISTSSNCTNKKDKYLQNNQTQQHVFGEEGEEKKKGLYFTWITDQKVWGEYMDYRCSYQNEELICFLEVVCLIPEWIFRSNIGNILTFNKYFVLALIFRCLLTIELLARSVSYFFDLKGICGKASFSPRLQTASASPAIANKPIPNRPAPIPNRP